MPIDNIAQLHAHLRLALRIELAVIPPYLYAMYSIEDQTSESALLIRSIVAEEMLHAALVSNVLLATGGEPNFRDDDLIASYPLMLPHHTPALELGLQPCSGSLISDVFMTLEQPETHELPEDPDEFLSLGQFYHALENGLAHLAQTSDLFGDPQLGRQLSDPAYYSPVEFDEEDSGNLLLVHDLDSAFAAIEIIVHQGEGVSTERWADPSHQELTHYHKLMQIADGTSPLGAVRNVPSNPRVVDFPDDLQQVARFFNASYRYLFFVLAELFLDNEDKGAIVGVMYLMMSSVLSPTARILVEQRLENDMFAAPTFELYEFTTETPLRELAHLANAALVGHPDLQQVADIVKSMV